MRILGSLLLFLLLTPGSAATQAGSIEPPAGHLRAQLSQAPGRDAPRPSKPGRTVVGSEERSDSITLKFAEQSGVRWRGGAFRAPGLELRPLRRVLRQFGIDRGAIRRLFGRDELALDADRQLAQQRSGRQLADLNLYHEIRVPAGVDAALLCDALNALSVVELAEPSPRPAPLALDLPPTTPDFSSLQGYLDAPPGGIGATLVRNVPGATGSATAFADVEYSWVLDHEDLEIPVSAVIEPLAAQDPFGSTNHGTAVLGVVAGRDNGYGITGITPLTTPRVAPAQTQALGFNAARAIDLAAAALDPGDVILIELASASGCGCTPSTPCMPMERSQPVFDAISQATALGIIVVEAAGNGSVNLDTCLINGQPIFDPAFRDSGAIMVGASAGSSLQRASFSSHGQRVNAQGWGFLVATTGYGLLFDDTPSDPRQQYTSSFSGTSSASPVVVGAVLSIQGALRAQGQPVLTPAEMRALLGDTGTPQTPEPEQIGPRPNLPGALGFLGLVPPGDDFADRRPVFGQGGSVTAPNSGATSEPGEPFHANTPANRSLWWTWTAPTSGFVILDTTGSTFATRLGVYTGSAVDALTLVAQDDSDGGITSVGILATAGTEYQIAIDTEVGLTGSAVLRWSQTPIGNDNFADRFTLAGTLASGSANNTLATREPGEPFHAGSQGGHSMWWTWTVPQIAGAPELRVTIDTEGSDFDTVLGVYTAPPFGLLDLTTLQPRASDDSSGAGSTSRVSFLAAPGEVLYIAVDGFANTSGTIALQIEAVNNDLFVHRFDLEGLAGATIGSNILASRETGEPFHAGRAGGRSIWWSWTAPVDGDATFSTAGSSFDTVLGVYTGNAVDALTTIASSDDDTPLTTSRVTFAAQAGVEYRIAVDGFGGLSGDVVLSWDTQVASALYTIAGQESLLRVVSMTDASTLSSTPVMLPSGEPTSLTGLALHPFTGQMFAIAAEGGPAPRDLITIDPATGAGTLIGNTGQAIAAITFDCSGTLWAVTGDGGSDPEALYQLSTADGSSTRIRSLGNGDSGEALAFNPDDGLLYHASGGNTVVFESIDPQTLDVTDIDISGTALADGEARALGYSTDLGEFLWHRGIQQLYTATPAGAVTGLIGSLDHQAKGFAFVGADAGCPATLTVMTTGQGSIAGPGLSCPGDCTEDLAPGAQVSITATPATGWSFDGWSGACAGQGSTCTITMSQPRATGATFVQDQHTLQVSVSGAGSVTGAGIDCPGDCEETLPSGAMITLTATADTGSAFVDWQGGCLFQGNPCVLTLQNDETAIASFSGIDVDLDGIPDTLDVCPLEPDPGQADTNGDGRGDACECGDQNGDGLINVGDILAINAAIFDPGLVTPLCDANHDGACNIGDILAVNAAIFDPLSTTCSRSPVAGR